MRITYNLDEKMNHHEIRLGVHPRNERVIRLLAKQFRESLGEIEVYDDCRNVYTISMLAIYYFELVDHKIYAYTEREVFRVGQIKMSALKEKVKKFGFYQINVRTLVNFQHILTYQKQVGCRRRLVLDNKEVLISTRQFYKEFDLMIEDRQKFKEKYRKSKEKTE